MGSPTNAPQSGASAGVAKLRETLVPQSVTVSLKAFVMLYALLGTVQAMVYVYFIGTLTSFERRFRLPSLTIGIILAGNELGQAALSIAFLVLKRRIVSRPVCLAWAVALSAAACFVLAGPYMGFGSAPWGRNHALAPFAADAAARNFTASFGSDWQNEAAAKSAASSVTANEMCEQTSYPRVQLVQCDRLQGYSEYSQSMWGEYGGLPTVLGFVAHLLLGAATTIYLSLGQIYVDAGEQKTSLPLLLGLTLSLRAVGPALGFLLAAGCTALFDDQALVPMIRRNDPRWLGAWWLGWFLLGSILLLCAVPLAVFAKRIRVASYKEQNILQQATRALRNGKNVEKSTSAEPLQAAADLKLEADGVHGVTAVIKRLARNRIFMCNVWSGVFYLFGTCGFLNYITKYLEVQFDLSAAVANLIIAPTSIIAILGGLTIAGVVISRRHPRPRVLLAWNIIVGVIYVLGHIAFIFLGCNDADLQGYSPYSYEKFQLTMECNRYCQCRKQFNPVCDTSLRITYFSACHGGCTYPTIDYDVKGYNNCSCKGSDFGAPFHAHNYQIGYDSVRTGGSYNNWPSTGTQGRQYDPRGNQWQQQQPYSGGGSSWNNPRGNYPPRVRRQTPYNPGSRGWNDNYQQGPGSLLGYGPWKGMTVGVCEPYCGSTLLIFVIISFIIQMLGSSGRIGNLLVNYRSVDPADKPLAQTISLIIISLFGLIPGLIIFGVVIDASCVVWDDSCGLKGPCMLYDRTNFRLYFNLLSLVSIAIGTLLDGAACYLGRDLNLYPNEDESEKDDDEQYDAEPPPPPSTTQDNSESLQPLEQHISSSSTV